MKQFEMKLRRGVDDLKSLFAFHGNSQGDESCTNDIEVYKASKGWMTFTFDCDLTEEAIQAEIETRKKANEEYVKSLKESGKYEEEYTVKIQFNDHPMFDRVDDTKEFPLSSYRMIFLDDSNLSS